MPDDGQQARGNDWLEFGTYAPVQRYYRDLPRAEVDSLVTNFSHSVLTQQPLRVLDAYGRDVLKLFAVDRVTAPGDPPICRWQFQTAFPYFSSHATPSIVKAAVGPVRRRQASRLAARSPRSCAPISSTAATRPDPLLVLFTVTGLVGSVVRAAQAGGTGRSASSRSPACCSSPRQCR